MLASAGNLSGLVGFSFGSTQFAGITVTSFSQSADGAVRNVLTQVLGNTSSLAAAGTPSTYTVTGIANDANQIALNQYQTVSGSTTFVQTLTYNVLGYNAQSLLISALSLDGLVGALQAGQSVAAQIGVITAGTLARGAALNFTPDGAFTAAIGCFTLGTRIRAQRGEIAVEALRPGDAVPGQVSGRMRRVCRVLRRLVPVAAHPRPWDVAPVRILAGAFAPGLPHRDLRLSPDHAVLVQGVLIPVRYLLNGATVVQEHVAEITYLHVELDAHDVVLAEGLPCESYLETGLHAALPRAPRRPAARRPAPWRLPARVLGTERPLQHGEPR